MTRVVIYSHGFGVRKDDRGLFTDIAAGLPYAEHVMFDYDHIDDAANTLTAASLTEQAGKLREKVAEMQDIHPGAVIDLVCHSQGCLAVAIAGASGIRKTVFTAPPPDADMESKVKRWRLRYGTRFTTMGTSYLERKDGSTTIVPPEYWASLENIDAQRLYNELTKNTELVIVTATEDEVLGRVVLDGLSPNVKVIELPASHNFEGKARAKLTAIVARELAFE